MIRPLHHRLLDPATEEATAADPMKFPATEATTEATTEAPHDHESDVDAKDVDVAAPPAPPAPPPLPGMPQQMQPSLVATAFGAKIQSFNPDKALAQVEINETIAMIRNNFCRELRIPCSGVVELDSLIRASRLADYMAHGDSLEGASNRLNQLFPPIPTPSARCSV